MFDNSAMDGYAVIASCCEPGARLRVVGEQPAGLNRGLALRHGEAIRIFTGAPMPEGADAVVMQEDVERIGDEILLHERAQPGEFVRRKGGDVTTGQTIVRKGERLRPQNIALLAAQGISTVVVGGEASASIISTGDELRPPGAELAAGEIHESNATMLQALLEQLGVRVASVTHCRDDSAEIEAAIRAAAAKCDIMIISGGVSVGARDLVKPALAAVGAQLDLWRVAVKPGKPFLFGHTGQCGVFGLPGNPISAFVTFLLFVRPALLRLMGAGDEFLSLPGFPARLEEELRNDGDRPHYIRGMLSGGIFSPVGRQESHALFGLSRSNSLLLVPPNVRIAAGELVSVCTWECA